MMGRWAWQKYMMKNGQQLLNDLHITKHNCLQTNTAMGLENRVAKTYLGIVEGKISKRVTETTPGAIERTTSEGKKVHELRWDCISGFLESMTVRDGKYGREWLLEIGCAGELFQMQLSYSGGYSKGILMGMPNIDFGREIRFTPWQKEVMGDDGKMQKRTALYLSQPNGITFVNNETGDQIKWYYTKEDPKGLPDMVKMTVKNKEVWDDTERMKFLEERFRNEWSLDIKNAAFNRSAGAGTSEAKKMVDTAKEYNPEEAETFEPTDDLPF